tara:strand:- start:140 stop:364 length:225 start_codon:yes stop_codon:yes gene_type:complete
MGKKKKMKYKDGGKVKGKFPDLTGDGKVTKKDILKGRGVKGMMGGGMVKYKDGGKVDTKGQGAQVKPNLFSGIY